MNKTQEMTIFITDDDNYTVATYTLEYEMSYLEDNETVDQLFSLLTGLFTELLKNKSINQWAVADEFLDYYADHLNNVESKCRTSRIIYFVLLLSQRDAESSQDR